MQIEKGFKIKPNIKRYSKKVHHKQKRLEAKQINKSNPQYNRYTDGWVIQFTTIKLMKHEF